jgi:hypothetical protein
MLQEANNRRSARESHAGGGNMFVESMRIIYIKAESKATLGLFERRIKDKTKEIETFVTTDCLTVMLFRLFLSFVLFLCCSSMFCSF